MNIHRNQATRILMSVVVALVGSRCAFAHSDVFLTNVGGQVTVGGANDLDSANPFYELTTHVFEGVMVTGYPPLGSNDYGRGEPGFFALADGSADLPSGAAALAPNADVTINLPAFTINGNSDTLFHWDGLGAVDFQPVATSSQPSVILSLDPNPIDSTASDGFLHAHPAYELDNGGTGVPADGVYLAAPTTSVAGMTDSEPFYLVWLVDHSLVDDDTAEGLEGILESGGTYYPDVDKDFGFYVDAVDYVRTTFQVPEPTSRLLGVLALSGLSLLVSRQRNSGRND